MNAVPLPSFAGSKSATAMIALAIGLGIAGCLSINLMLNPNLHAGAASPFVGCYHGSLVEADTDGLNLSTDSVDTDFVQLPDGTLVGDYRVKERAETYTGYLVQNGPIQDHTATFRWADQFGRGTVEATFDDDYCTFRGKWQNDEGTMINEPWNGHR
jgi:hypothetical protein